MNHLRVLFALIVLVASGCRTPERGVEYKVTRFAMGTIVEYTIAAGGHTAGNETAGRDAVDFSHRELERISSLLWEGDSLSAIFQFNSSTDSAKVGSEVLAFLERSRQFHEDTHGAFDITIGPVLSLYDFSSEDAKPPATDAITDQLELVGIDGFRRGIGGYVVKKRPDVSLAVGGVAKGYGVDKAVEVLRTLGVQGALINAGGDLYCLGTNNGRRWRVGIRDPDDQSSIIQVLHVSDEAVATSGDYQQFFMLDGVRYHHILDPTEGRPARGIRSATVIASTTEIADALATAAFILGSRRGIKLLEARGVNGLLIDSSGQWHQTDGLSKYFESN